MLDALPTFRARIGLIIPSSNRLTEPQMRRYAPEGVEVHVTSLRMTGANHVPLERLIPQIADATAALADARCDVIVFHCTASSMQAGVAGERQVLEAMARGTERPVDAQGLFLSCTNVHSPPVIQPLETLTGRPVVTSNQAVLWHALRLCALDDVIPELGQLFQLTSADVEVAQRRIGRGQHASVP